MVWNSTTRSSNELKHIHPNTGANNNNNVNIISHVNTFIRNKHKQTTIAHNNKVNINVNNTTSSNNNGTLLHNTKIKITTIFT